MDKSRPFLVHSALWKAEKELTSSLEHWNESWVIPRGDKLSTRQMVIGVAWKSWGCLMSCQSSLVQPDVVLVSQGAGCRDGNWPYLIDYSHWNLLDSVRFLRSPVCLMGSKRGQYHTTFAKDSDQEAQLQRHGIRIPQCEIFNRWLRWADPSWFLRYLKAMINQLCRNLDTGKREGDTRSADVLSHRRKKGGFYFYHIILSRGCIIGSNEGIRSADAL